MSTRVPMACPNCQNSLMVRTEYFGHVIECLKCQHPFKPMAADVLPGVPDELAFQTPARVEKIKVECSHCHQQVKVRPQYLGRTITCCLCNNTFRATSPAEEAPGRSQAVEPSIFTRFEQRLGGLESRIESLQAESTTPHAGLERALAELEQGRQALAPFEDRIEALRGDLDAVRQESLGTFEALERSIGVDVESRLEGLRQQIQEAQSRQDEALEPLRRQTAELAGARGEIERLAVALDALRHRLEAEATRLEEQHETLGRLAGDQTWNSEQVRVLTEQQVAFDTRVAGLESARGETARSLTLLGEQVIEARDQDQSWRTGAETERGGLQDELKQLRLELQAVQKEARERSEQDRAAIEELRNELRQRPAPVQAPAPVEGPAAGVVGLSRTPLPLDLHELAQDLIDWRAAPAVTPPAIATNGSASDEADYEELRSQFNMSMGEGNLERASATARKLLEMSRLRFGERSSKHALWLRNLGVCLTSKGELAEARSILLLAWEISMAELRSNPLPHAVCLVDLGDLHAAEKDFTQARTAYLHAEAILRKVGLPGDNPLVLRAQRALKQFDAKPRTPSKFGTMSITT